MVVKLKSSVWGDPHIVWEEIKNNTPLSKELLFVDSSMIQFNTSITNNKKNLETKNNAPEKITLNIYWPENYMVNESVTPHYNKKDADWVDEKIEEWVIQKRLGYDSKDVKVMIKDIDLGLLCSSCWPTSSREQLLFIAKFHVFLALADDLFAEQSIESMRQTLNRPDLDRWEVMYTWVNMILPGHNLDKISIVIHSQPLLVAWAEWCIELQKIAPIEWLKVFHWTVSMYAKSCYVESCMLRGEINFSFEDYCILRVHSVCCLPCICLNDLPLDFKSHSKGSPVLSETKIPYNLEFFIFVNDLCLGSQSLLNDVLSSYRESKIDGTLNAVKVLNIIKPTESISQHVKRLESMMNALILTAEKNLKVALENKSIDVTNHKDVNHFINACRVMAKGMTDWQMLASRYTKYQSNDPSFPAFNIAVKQR